MLQFHIINVGNSLLSNCLNENLVEREPFANNAFWQLKLEDKNFMDKIYGETKLRPEKFSAELNSFLKFVKMQNENFSHITIYFTGTNTSSNNICLEIVRKYVKFELGCNVLDPKEFSGYFTEASSYDSKYAVNEFTKGISNMLDTFIGLAKKKKNEGYQVYFNPTGGFKAHVIACSTAAILTATQVYYIQEEFQELVIFPQLFYLPRGKEIDVLKQLSDKVPVSGDKFKELETRFSNELERLETYGLISIETNEYNSPFRTKITNRGLHFLELKIESSK